MTEDYLGVTGTKERPFRFASDVKGCSRCGLDHEGLMHQKFGNPFAPTEAAPIIWEYWSTCPRTGDPILTSISPVPEPARES